MATEGIILGNVLGALLKGPRIPGLSVTIKELIPGLNFGNISTTGCKPRMAAYNRDRARGPAALSTVCKSWGQQGKPAPGEML